MIESHNPGGTSSTAPSGARPPAQAGQAPPTSEVAQTPTQAAKDRLVEWYKRLVVFTEQRPWLTIAALVIVGLIGLSMLGVSALGSSAVPTPTPVPSAKLSPEKAEPGGLVVVTGTGWHPGDSLSVTLVGLVDGQEIRAVLSHATVTNDGSFTAPFLFPSDERWTQQLRVIVTVQSQVTGAEVSMVLGVASTAQTPTPLPTTTITSTTPTVTATTTVTPTLSPTPMPSIQPTASPTPVDGWHGEYYANRDLTGGAMLTRIDAGVNFDWGTASPANVLPADGFSARWTRVFSFRAGTHRFSVRSDDGVRIWLDGELIIDQWHDASSVTYAAERKLSAGSHTLRIEYYENVGVASIQFWWERIGDFPQWRGEYFSSVNLTGWPVVVRNDPTVTFDWGRGAPDLALPVDSFSVRWTRALDFEAALYRFHVIVDDGVRLYVDDELVIDDWQDGGRREVTADRLMSAGSHDLRIEYYERTGEALIHVWWERPATYPDWRGEYWSNRGLDGSPTRVRNDKSIDFNWGWGAPAADIPADNFSVRWTRALDFDAATYRFHTRADDGVRLWVDGQLIINDWQDGAPREQTADYALVQGVHNLQVEFYEHLGSAQVRVWWGKVSTPSYPDWKGEYWSNRDLSGNPVLVRNDRKIDFFWGGGSPAVGLPEDSFSARWSRQETFDPGVYRFYAQADDGVRLYVDGNLVLDEWHVSNGETIYTVDAAMTGQHSLEILYYELGGNALIRFWWERVSDLPTSTPTSTPTATSTFTPEPGPTSTPTSTPLPTSTLMPTPEPTLTLAPTPEPTLTLTPTPGQTNTATMTATPEPATATPTLMPTPPPTSTPTPVAALTGVRLNEVKPVADTVPTTRTASANGTVGTPGEWIELYNAGPAAADVSNWLLDDAEGGSTPYQIPAGTLLQPGAFLLFLGNETGIVLEDTGDEVRLMEPDGTVADSVAFGPLVPDSSLSRDESGVWHDDWQPSPGAPNVPPVVMELERAVPPAAALEDTRALEKRDNLKREVIGGKR
jgi:hypothetical protein